MSSKDALSGIDLHRMLASGAQLAAENSRLEAENLRGIVNQQGAEIAYLKAQLAMAESARVTADRRKQADELCKAAKRAHAELSKELAERYGVDFKTATFCPETGQITAGTGTDSGTNTSL